MTAVNWNPGDLITATKLDAGAYGEVADIAALIAVNTSTFTTSKKVYVVANQTHYYFNPTSTAAFDNGVRNTVLKPTTGGGRWFLAKPRDYGLGGTLFLVDPKNPGAFDRNHFVSLDSQYNRPPFVTVTSAMDSYSSVVDTAVNEAILLIAPGDYTGEGPLGMFFIGDGTNNGSGGTLRGLTNSQPKFTGTMAAKDQVLLHDLAITVAANGSISVKQVTVKDISVKSVSLYNNGVTDGLGANGANYTFENVQFTGGAGASGECITLTDGQVNHFINPDLFGYAATFKGCFLNGLTFYEVSNPSNTLDPTPTQNSYFYFDDCTFKNFDMSAFVSNTNFVSSTVMVFRNCVFFGTAKFCGVENLIFCALQNGVTSGSPTQHTCVTSF